MFRDLEIPHAVKVWESFSLWWWAGFGVRAYMDRYTGLFMPDLTERMYDGFYENNLAAGASQSMYIMLLFKQPAGVIPSNSRQLYFSTITDTDFMCGKKDIAGYIPRLFGFLAAEFWADRIMRFFFPRLKFYYIKCTMCEAVFIHFLKNRKVLEGTLAEAPLCGVISACGSI
ncbi:hypothetical protein [Paenibacillus nanchangensis]|uniref:hypothetical protein n=1 Tax=Paenibacillus nanchangensis TaxID=3348343 RepID=UPI00397C5667